MHPGLRSRRRAAHGICVDTAVRWEETLDSVLIIVTATFEVQKWL